MANYTECFTATLNDKTEYVFVDPSAKTHFKVPNRDGFEYAVSFWEGPRDFSMNYPVVFDDYTTSDGRKLVRIAYEDVPAALKRKFTKWKKFA